MGDWGQPAAIIGAVIAVNSITMYLTSKRIDDVGKRFDDMGKRLSGLHTDIRENHSNLDNHLTRVEGKLDSHTINHSIHKSYEDLGFMTPQSPFSTTSRK